LLAVEEKRFFVDLVAGNAARPSPSKACRRVVASFRNGEYRRFPADTFPAVWAPHPAGTSTCRASVSSACLCDGTGNCADASAEPERFSTGRAAREFTRSRGGYR
jgi:hypothetical protein